MSLTPEIKEKRAGKVTGSQVNRIMAGWDKPPAVKPDCPELLAFIMTAKQKPQVKQIKPMVTYEVNTKLIDACWAYKQSLKPNAGMLSYAHELACDLLFVPDDSIIEFQTQEMINGHLREQDAVDLLKEKTGRVYYGTGDDQQHFSTDGCGVTPDGYSLNELGLVDRGLEIKSRISTHHLAQCDIRDNLTLLELDFSRYCQIMLGFYVMQCEFWESVNYNPFCKLRSLRLHHVVIERDEPFIKIMQSRIERCIQIRDEIVNKAKRLNQEKEAQNDSQN